MHALWIGLILALAPRSEGPDKFLYKIGSFDTQQECQDFVKAFVASRPADEAAQAVCIRKTQPGEAET